MIKVIRVDHRLLHGQVIFSWTKFASIERVIVIDTATAKDDFKKMSLKLAKPEDVRLNVFSVDAAIEKIEQIKALKDNIMLIFENINELFKFIEAYGPVEEINYGLVPAKPDAKRFSNAIYLTAEEVALTKKMCAEGIKISMQQVPSANKELLNNVI
ncbi:PTS sugar transporter subunit IIB [Lactobacillus xylocopicola]|uniref:PTS sorbose transporter subunit IIC n=1 Tax=Lactobacillus xylocopicola TaxID=2976676 RepID=A0ABM8BFN1_9LACO|nr:PTS sugar transporter subunit IIB [Lactobacillus xylocopicola]BDR60065.1 PTS sorbose transporter subunit IIC [Lactobacillus xylocopicola]